MLPGIGVPELLIVLVIIIVIFGAGRIGDIGGALGKGIREFRHSVKEDPEPGSEKDGKDS